MPVFGTLIKRVLTLGDKMGERYRRVPAIRHQSQMLKRLLHRAEHTLFGKYYDFRGILEAPDVIEAFQEYVPIHDYDKMHHQWWHLSLRHLKNISWPGKIRYFALSSGTSGAPSKHIPITDDMMKSMRKAGMRMFMSLNKFDVHPELFTKDMMMLGGSSALQNQGDYYLGDLSGINASKPPFWLRPYYKPGAKISRISDWNRRIEEIAKLAPTWDVGFLVGIPSWLQLMMERIIERHGLETIHDVWPNLQVCVHGGVHFEPYKKSFEKLLAHPLVYIDSYLASEGFIAFQNRPETKAMRLLLHNGIFYEFLPFREEYFDPEGNIIGNPPALSIDAIEEGIDYALLLTTCAGAWRYLIGDTVRFTDKARSEIIITGRTKHFLSITGEHLSVDNMNRAIQHVEEELNISIPEFTVTARESGTFFAHHWFIGADPLAPADRVKALIDEKLRQVNDDYNTERNHVLREPQVAVIPAALFYQYQEKLGKMGGQNKFPRVMKKAHFEDWQRFVSEHYDVALR